ncbi:MAG TPA: N-acetyltransferase [bacterium]|nr:N-acetyltransferase [bacterium]
MGARVITVDEAASRRALAEFIAFPYRLYRDDANWVPPLKRDVKFTFGPKNPFWRHAERALFVARREGRVVGRVAAIQDDDYIKFAGEPCGYFGFFEAEEDGEAAAALWDAAASWLRGRGLTKFIGPMNPSTNEECAFLVEGFDRPPYIMMTHNPPYYAALAEEYGFRKARDLFAFVLGISPARLERLERVAARARARDPGLTVRCVNLRDFAAELRLIREVYNRAWDDNWGFVPPTPEEFDSTADRLKSLAVPELVPIAFVDGEPAGFIVTIPNYNEVLAGMGGSLGPLSLLKFLTGRRKIRSCRVMLFGVCPEYRKRGIDAVLMASNQRAALELGYREAEFSWVLEENEMTKRAAKMLGARPYKRYRIYEKEI